MKPAPFSPRSLFISAVTAIVILTVTGWSLWSLAGALYPAIDVCAGEKERGTMETLLISPASREEIVWGKFLTIWVFSAATALLNLFSMGVTMMQFAKIAEFRPASLFWWRGRGR